MLLSCENVGFSYGSHCALQGVDCSLGTGEIVGLLGPNGAGKSTLLRLLAGVYLPNAGCVRWQGESTALLPAAWRREVGYMPEHNPLALELDVREHLEWTARMHGLEKAYARRRLEAVVAQCHLAPVWGLQAGALSRGYRQRLGLACALLHEPSLLLLDEPTTGLDPNEIESLLSMIRSLGHERTIVHSTHILSEAQQTCSRLWILRQGSLVADAPPARLLGGTAIWELRTAKAGLQAALHGLPGVARVEENQEGTYTLYTLHAQEDAVNLELGLGDYCLSQGIAVYGLKPIKTGLQEAFARLTREPSL